MSIAASAAAAAAAAPSSSKLSFGPYYCYYCRAEGIGCSTSNGTTNSWIKSPSDIHKISDHSGLSFRCENPFFGVRQFHQLPNGHQSCDFKVSVAADYSDSLPESSNFIGENGYHPLEELKKDRTARVTKLTDAEIARTAVENALIGMGIPQYKHRRINSSAYSILESGYDDDIPSHYDFEFENSKSDLRVDFGMPNSSSWVHPVHFSKCLEKAVDKKCLKMMDRPSNGVSLWGHLRPAYVDEESYLRKIFNDEDNDDSSWSDGESVNSHTDDGSCRRSSIYKFEITKVELYSVYGVQLDISLEDFEDAEPDILVHSAPSLVERYGDQGTKCSFALKALCKKKGLIVEGANLIGIDSLGMDVRLFSGSEVLTHRFHFKVRATSESAAEKQIQQLLFPRSRRKKFRTVEKSSDRDSF
ncbi:OLC1v1018763C2 [Oldenlandia corymbosa var. corymbosa]|uniref:OLC1v1018763C2 n=1 Tax=Oldenlandia corymbosa var. corymbosa TaxID=529605 RepID=A0AAV1ECG2_OLDCO|nr:OLC1v1018763C2 [Oldenlandia corymbosa var. corymbosa]